MDMYSFEPTDEQQMLIDVAKRFAENDLRPAAHDAEEHRGFPDPLIEKGWELGVLQASVPEEYGGFGERSVLTSILAAEELAWGDLAGALAIMGPSLYVSPILAAGTDAQKSKYLPPVVEAEWQPFTAAMVEYAYDFDPAELRTTAAREGDEYVLTGQKCAVPFADQAVGMIVYANLEGQTQAFILPADTEGVVVGEKDKYMGLNALPLFSVNFDGVRLPLDSRLGGEDGHDFASILASFQISMAALAVGMAKASFEYARDYSKERYVLGSYIGQKQSIAFMLAEMATEIEAIRMLTWEAAWQLDNGFDEAARTAYLAYQGAIDMALMVTDRGVQILGGHGYIREHPVELWYRNSRAISALIGLALV
jgi:alkylation response protein AidB-like acyl-CoA dehydrogenase